MFADTPKDGAVLFDLEHDRLLKLNPVGAEMWRRLNAGETEEQVVDGIAEQFHADKYRVAADLRTFLLRTERLHIRPPKATCPEEGISDPGAESSPFRLASDEGENQAKTAAWMVLWAFLGLATFDLVLHAGSLKRLCRTVQAWPLKGRTAKNDATAIHQVRTAVDRACVWYPKKALCLQRSAVTTCLLRTRGVPARLVIGARPMPFFAHAWVEVDAVVVNDVAGVKRFYRPLVSY
jgi:hypothetical protein